MKKGTFYTLGSVTKKTFVACLLLFVCVGIISLYSQKETSPRHGVTLHTIKKYQYKAKMRPTQHRPKMSPGSICLQSMGRLGNQLFQYASNFGIARSNNMTVTVQHKFSLTKIFKLTAKPSRCKCVKSVFESKGCTFEKGLMHVSGKNHVCIKGYLQSWKYFQNSKSLLRKEFTFLDNIKQIANRILSSMIRNNKEVTKSKIVYIGVHVRRGDFISNPKLVDYGYVSADTEYLDMAMKYFREKYKTVLFVVASDDISWCREKLIGKDVVFVPERNPPAVDLAILTMCNHTIITSGSFGWWAGWLTGGEVVYYGGFPKPGSKLDSFFNEDDYRYPGWIKM